MSDVSVVCLCDSKLLSTMEIGGRCFLLCLIWRSTSVMPSFLQLGIFFCLVCAVCVWCVPPFVVLGVLRLWQRPSWGYSISASLGVRLLVRWSWIQEETGSYLVYPLGWYRIVLQYPVKGPPIVCSLSDRAFCHGGRCFNISIVNVFSVGSWRWTFWSSRIRWDSCWTLIDGSIECYRSGTICSLPWNFSILSCLDFLQVLASLLTCVPCGKIVCRFSLECTLVSSRSVLGLYVHPFPSIFLARPHFRWGDGFCPLRISAWGWHWFPWLRSLDSACPGMVPLSIVLLGLVCRRIPKPVWIARFYNYRPWIRGTGQGVPNQPLWIAL